MATSTHTTESNHNLSGDWTISGIVGQLDLLSSSLNTLESAGKMRVHIDFVKINAIDMSGMQLLNVWLQCCKWRGVEPTLVNVPESFSHIMLRTGLPWPLL